MLFSRFTVYRITLIHRTLIECILFYLCKIYEVVQISHYQESSNRIKTVSEAIFFIQQFCV